MALSHWFFADDMSEQVYYLPPIQSDSLAKPQVCDAYDNCKTFGVFAIRAEYYQCAE